jgi:glycerophosphoryl diester phosphodiesterase
MKIVGHRGVRNSYTENTLKAMQKAINEGADAVECDVRLSKDGVAVICHNSNLKEVYGIDKHVHELNFTELRELRSPTNDKIPSLEEVFDLELTKPVILDIKNSGSAKVVKKIVDTKKIKNDEWMITTFLHQEAIEFKKIFPGLKVLLGTYQRPFQTIKLAKSIEAYGVTFNLISLNILSYRYAKNSGLKIFLYQNYLPFLLTNPKSVKIILKLYPKISIYSDQPSRILDVV